MDFSWFAIKFSILAEFLIKCGYLSLNQNIPLTSISEKQHPSFLPFPKFPYSFVWPHTKWSMLWLCSTTNFVVSLCDKGVTMWRRDYTADSEILAWDTFKWLCSTLRKVAYEPDCNDQVFFRWQTTSSDFLHESREHSTIKCTKFPQVSSFLIFTGQDTCLQAEV